MKNKIDEMKNNMDSKMLCKMHFESVNQLYLILENNDHFKTKKNIDLLDKYLDYCNHFYDGNDVALKEKQNLYLEQIIANLASYQGYVREGISCLFVSLGIVLTCSFSCLVLGHYIIISRQLHLRCGLV